MLGVSLRSATGGILVAILVGAPVAVGTVHRWTRVAVFVACALALATTLVDRWRRKRPFIVTVPLVALGLATAVTAAQLVPLPGWLLSVISPTGWELFVTELGEIRTHAISLDPPSTWGDLARLGAYTAFFAAAVMFASRSARRNLLVLSVIGAAVVVAAIGMASSLLGRHELAFVYEATEAFWEPRVVRGTFVNPNHLGALLCVAAPAALVLALRAESSTRARLLLGGAAFFLNLGAMLTFKRATIACVLLGDVLAVVLGMAAARRAGRWRLAAVGLALAGIAGGLAISGGAVLSEMSQTSVVAELEGTHSRGQLWRDGLALSWDYPWTGVGRGAFEPAFTRYSTVSGQMRHEFVENGYLQAMIDLGWPAGLALLALAVWGAVLAFRGAGAEPLAAAAAAGIIALALHQAADFAIELPGVALPALAMLATLFGNGSEPRRGRRRFPIHPAALVAPLVLLAAIGGYIASPGLEEDRDRLTHLAADRAVPTATVVEVGQALRVRHPADYYLLALVAQRLVRDGDAAALGWLNGALFLNPRHPALHVLAAETFAARGRRSQALLEYRLAAEFARDPRAQVWQRVVRRYPDLDALIAATPKLRGHLALAGKWLNALGRHADADRLYGMAVAAGPDDARLLGIWARLAVDRGDLPAARERVERLLIIDNGAFARHLRVRLELLAGNLALAERLAAAERDHSPMVFDTQLALATELIRRGELGRARALLDGLRTWVLDRAASARLHGTRAELEKAAGNEHQYRWEIEQRDRK